MLAKKYWIAAVACLTIANLSHAADNSSASALKTCSRCRLLSGWGMGVVKESAFDADKIKTVQGEVLSVQNLPSEGEVVGGVYVLLKTDAGNVAVRLGPSAYVLKDGMSIEPYDALTVTGSEVGAEEKPGIIATQVQKGADTLQLRGTNGAVAWR